MGLDEKLKELHGLGMKAVRILGKEENEPRTSYKLLPNGKSLVVFYSTCFSFIPPNENQIVFDSLLLDKYIEQARQEVSLYEEIGARQDSVLTSFKQEPHVIPFIIHMNGVTRLYKYHLCKQHRSKQQINRYKTTQCHCFMTWEEFGDKHHE